jgi:hypothetical protein
MMYESSIEKMGVIGTVTGVARFLLAEMFL